MNITSQHKEKATEIAYATGKGLIAGIPFVGGVAAELLGVAIPNKRMERVEQMLNQFAEKVKDIEQSVLHQRMREPNFEELFEEGCYEAAKTTAKIKLQVVANVLASGISREGNTAYIKRILNVCSKLDELDLVIFITLYERYFATDNSKAKLSQFALKNEYHQEFSELELDTHIVGYITAQWFGVPIEEYDTGSENHWLCFSATASSISRLISENLLQISNEKLPGVDNDVYSTTVFGGDFIDYITE